MKNSNQPFLWKEVQISLTTLLCLLLSIVSFGQGFENFITTDGHKLMDGDKEFRFISFNIPNLNYIEDEMSFHNTNPYGLPNEYELRDAFSTIKELGGQLIRMYTFPVYNTDFPEAAPTYVEAPGQFNERAFRTMDTLLALANEYEIRLILPFINNWQWMGGRPNFTAFYDKPEDDFWTDPEIIKGFKKTVKYILNRKNTVSGIKYKNDRAILCWQSGNELKSPAEWVLDIAKFVKKHDKNHLFMDGYYSINHHPVLESSIQSPDIDIITTHHYEEDPGLVIENIKSKVQQINGRKPLVVTEFGFWSTTAINSILDSIISTEEVSGALIWSLRYHHRNGGFYWHSEPMGMGLYKAYHWPGFDTGNAYDEKDLMHSMRSKAYKIQGKIAPPVSKPESPVLLPIDHITSIRWRGVMGAEGYILERSFELDGPWSVIAFNIHDAGNPVFPGYHDATAEVGQAYYYRIKAMNRSGMSAYSNVIGPVQVESQKLIDNMFNIGKCFSFEGDLGIERGHDRNFKEDLSRISGQNGAELIYFVPGSFQNFDLFAFGENEHGLKFFGSMDNQNYFPLDNIQVQHFINEERNYGYVSPIHFHYSSEEPIQYIKIHFSDKISLSRMEIEYDQQENEPLRASKQ